MLPTHLRVCRDAGEALTLLTWASWLQCHLPNPPAPETGFCYPGLPAEGHGSCLAGSTPETPQLQGSGQVV